jgi:hypothetical protein
METRISNKTWRLGLKTNMKIWIKDIFLPHRRIIKFNRMFFFRMFFLPHRRIIKFNGMFFFRMFFCLTGG